MKRKAIPILILILGGLFAVSFVATANSIGDDFSTHPQAFSFATQTTDTLTGSVSGREVDYFMLENVESGLMSVSVSWGNSYDIDCYICTSASYSNYLARGYTTNNPETCSYTITTSGTYYIAIRMYSWWASSTAYTATVTYYTGGSGEDTTPPTVSITSPTNGATVKDSITITASASDTESGVDYLECEIGGNNLPVDSSSPYSWTFDTTRLTDGQYTINVKAYDNAGNLR